MLLPRPRVALFIISAAMFVLAGCGSEPSEPNRSVLPPGVSTPTAPILGANVAGDASGGDDTYKPFSNVTSPAAVASDGAEIVTLLRGAGTGSSFPVSDVRAIYENGKHVQGQALRDFARSEDAAAAFPSAAQFYGTPAFLDTPVMEAITGTGAAAAYSPAQRSRAVQTGVQRIMAHWMIQQVQTAEAKIWKGDPDPNDRSHNYVDNAWAIYVATPEGQTAPQSLSAVALETERTLGREGTIDKPIRDALAQAQDGAARRNLDVFLPAKDQLESRLYALFYARTARQLNEALKAATRGDADAAAASLTEGLFAYQTIQPIVAGASAEADDALLDYLRSNPRDLAPEARDAALAALNQASGDLKLAPSDRITPADYD